MRGLNADTTIQIKVEPALFYRACDELGLLVIQDMPSLYPKQSDVVFPTAEQQAEFERQFDILIEQHKSYPSIYTWVRPFPASQPNVFIACVSS